MDKKLIYTQLFFSLVLIVFCSQASEQHMVLLDGEYTTNTDYNSGTIVNKEITYNSGIRMTMNICGDVQAYEILNRNSVVLGSFTKTSNNNEIRIGIPFDITVFPFKVSSVFKNQINGNHKQPFQEKINSFEYKAEKKTNNIPQLNVNNQSSQAQWVALEGVLTSEKVDNKGKFIESTCIYENGVKMFQRKHNKDKSIKCELYFKDQVMASYEKKKNGGETTNNTFLFDPHVFPFTVLPSFNDEVNGKNKFDQGKPTSDQKNKMSKKIDDYKKVTERIKNNSDYNKLGLIGSFTGYIKSAHLHIVAEKTKNISFMQVPPCEAYDLNGLIDQRFTYAYLFAWAIINELSANSIVSGMRDKDIGKNIQHFKFDRNRSADNYISFLKDWKLSYKSDVKISRDNAEKEDIWFLISNSIVTLDFSDNCLKQGSDCISLFAHIDQLKVLTTYAFVLMIKQQENVFQCLVNKVESGIEIVAGQPITQEIKQFLGSLFGEDNFLIEEFIRLELQNQHQECVEGLVEAIGKLKSLVAGVVKKEKSEVKTEENKVIQALKVIAAVLSKGGNFALPKFVTAKNMIMNNMGHFFKESFKFIGGVVMAGSLFVCVYVLVYSLLEAQRQH